MVAVPRISLFKMCKTKSLFDYFATYIESSSYATGQVEYGPECRLNTILHTHIKNNFYGNTNKCVCDLIQRKFGPSSITSVRL